MFALLTDHYLLEHFDSSSSMSSHIREPPLDCDPSLASLTSSSSSSSSPSIMPVLLQHSKRKRLDAVLTKLSLSTCKDEFDSSKAFFFAETAAALAKQSHSQLDQLDHRPDLEGFPGSPGSDGAMRDRMPQKQPSVDTEMSITVGQLKLDMGESKSEARLCQHSNPLASLTGDEFKADPKVPTCATDSAHSKSESLFNSSSELVATSTTTAVCTPPTSDSAGGSTHLDETELERAKNDDSQEVEVTDTATTVVRHTSDNVLDSHQRAEPQLETSEPRAKLLGHDSRRHKVSENATVPDAQPRPRVPRTMRPAESAPFCTSLSRLPYLGHLSSDTLTSLLPCKCSQCRSHTDQASFKMPSLGPRTTWSWNHFSQDANLLIDPFSSYLFSANSTPDKQSLPVPCSPRFPVELTPPSKTPPQGSDAIELLSAAQNASSKLSCNQKKRSHSDSDMTPEYLSLFKSLTDRTHSLARPLNVTESGSVLLKNGRRVPKPLSKAALMQMPCSEHASPQESPLDLSVKPLSAHILAVGHKFPDLIGACSVPSLSTMSQHKSQYRFSLPHAISPLSLHLKSAADEHKSPFKRRNISSSDSLYSSSLSSISSLSPPFKASKAPGARFEFHSDDQVKFVKREPESSCVSTSTKPKNSRSGKVSQCREDKTPSLSSLSDLSESVSSSPHACSLCGQTFAFYDRLAKHMASRHRNRQQCDSAGKNYTCDVCNRGFARSDMLTRHRRLHTNEKPYTCGICNQVFSRSDHLSTHQRTHTGEKPYKCPQCPYSACRRDMISRHMRTHSRHLAVPDSSSSFEDLSKSA